MKDIFINADMDADDVGEDFNPEIDSLAIDTKDSIYSDIPPRIELI